MEVQAQKRVAVLAADGLRTIVEDFQMERIRELPGDVNGPVES